MSKLLFFIFTVVYATGVLVGYAYFRTDNYAMTIRQNGLYLKIEPFIDDIFGAIAKDGPRTGRISAVLQGSEVRYRPANSLGFLPASPGQEFFGRTVIATGAKTKVQITAADGTYTFDVGENSTFILDAAESQSAQGRIREFSIQVVGGEVVTKKVASLDNTTGFSKAAPKLKVIGENGNESVLSDKVTQISKPVAIAYVPSKKKTLSETLKNDVETAKVMEGIKKDLIAETKLDEDTKGARLKETRAEELPIIETQSLASLQQPIREKEAPVVNVPTARLPASISESPTTAPVTPAKAWQVLATVLKGKSQRQERATISSKTQMKGINNLSEGGVFDTITRKNLDEILQSYVRTGQCSDAKVIIDKVSEAFPTDASTQAWRKQWMSPSSSPCKF